MFDKFGEFNSYTEINEKAAELKAANDINNLYALAEENGIDKEEAEDFFDGIAEELCNANMAAIGKLDIEAKEYKLDKILYDWVGELKSICLIMPEVAAGVRKKGKSIAEYIALIAEEGYANRVDVDKRIVEKTKEIKKIVGNHGFAIGVPDKAKRAEIAKNYYMN